MSAWGRRSRITGMGSQNTWRISAPNSISCRGSLWGSRVGCSKVVKIAQAKHQPLTAEPLNCSVSSNAVPYASANPEGQTSCWKPRSVPSTTQQPTNLKGDKSFSIPLLSWGRVRGKLRKSWRKRKAAKRLFISRLRWHRPSIGLQFSRGPTAVISDNTLVDSLCHWISVIVQPMHLFAFSQCCFFIYLKHTHKTSIMSRQFELSVRASSLCRIAGEWVMVVINAF